MSQSSNNLAANSWALADHPLRGDFKQSQYGRIILPFNLLRRLECVLEESKDAVFKEHEKVTKLNLPKEAQEKLLFRATKTTNNPDGLSFLNTSKMDLSKLGETGIKDNLESYIQGFSKDAHETFKYFNFAEFIVSFTMQTCRIKSYKKSAKLISAPRQPPTMTWDWCLKSSSAALQKVPISLRVYREWTF